MKAIIKPLKETSTTIPWSSWNINKGNRSRAEAFAVGENPLNRSGKPSKMGRYSLLCMETCSGSQMNGPSVANLVEYMDSKSFLCVLAYMIRAILYPGAKLFMVTGVKEQSATILADKFTEICTLIPALANEVIWDTRGTANKTMQTKDKVVFSFKNGSFLQNIPATQSTRGSRFHSGIMEECISIDQDILHEVIIPRNVWGLAA